MSHDFGLSNIVLSSPSADYRRMRHLGEVVREIRQGKKLTLEQATAGMEGYDTGNLSRFERGKSGITIERLEQIAHNLNVTPATLFQLRESSGRLAEQSGPDPNLWPALRTVLVPIISSVQAGRWGEINGQLTTDDAEHWIPAPLKVGRRAFALVVRGDSMINPQGHPSFTPGMIIHVNTEVEAQPGDFVVALCNGDTEATFKRLDRDGGQLLLVPLNPRYPVISIGDDTRIIGVVKHAGFDI